MFVQWETWTQQAMTWKHNKVSVMEPLNLARDMLLEYFLYEPYHVESLVLPDLLVSAELLIT